MEFLVLFAVMTMMFSGFMYFSHGQFERIENTQIEIDAQALGSDMSRYALTALKTDYLKIKNFRMPIDIGGRTYTASLAQDISETYLVINLTDTGRLFFFPLKKKVEGKIDKNLNFEHCITAKGDLASINPSSITLKPGRIRESVWRDMNESDFSGKTLNIPKNTEFSFYLVGNCIHDFENMVVNVVFESSKMNFEIIKESESHEKIDSGNTTTPYGNDFFSDDSRAIVTYNENAGNLNIEIEHVSPKIGPVGSDKMAEIVFTATGNDDTVMQVSASSFKDGLFRDELPLGEIIEIMII